VSTLHLGPYALSSVSPELPVMTLAPMAGVGNCVFRLLCARLGARVLGVEFVNARNLNDGSRRTALAVDFSDAEVYRASGQAVLAAQIYGNEPALVAAGAARLEALGAQVVDINFGCSVPRVMRKGSGAAYLRDLDRLYLAVRLTVEAVRVPVTVKTRVGWDQDSINVGEVVQRAQDAGARAIAVHARTVCQRYDGPADWSWIARAREVATIPVIGNGDVRSAEDACRMAAQTGCDAVMVGRAAMANPWIFAGRAGASRRERIDLAIEQLQRMATFKGERSGVLQTRKHLALYFRDLPRGDELRRQILTTATLAELIPLLRRWQEEQEQAEVDLILSASEARSMAWDT
jgi:nifR3 family TIM-barrel protein